MSNHRVVGGFFFNDKNLSRRFFFDRWISPPLPRQKTPTVGPDGSPWGPSNPLLTLVVVVPFHWTTCRIFGELLQNLSICSAKIGNLFQMNIKLGGGNSNILDFHPEAWGNDENVDTYFSDG